MPFHDDAAASHCKLTQSLLDFLPVHHEIGENRESWGFWVVGFAGKVGVCLSVLRSGGGWLKCGKTRKVKFLKVEEEKNELAMMMEFGTSENEGLKENDEEDAKSNCKRKRIVSADCEKKKKRLIKSSSGRSSKERYASAELNMLKILKEKGAVFRRPIMREALRMEARKLLGMHQLR